MESACAMAQACKPVPALQGLSITQAA